MSQKNNTPQEILQKIKDSDNILIFMDCRFDFDALGSALPMKLFLDQLGKKGEVFYEGTLPDTAHELSDTSPVKEKVDPRTVDYKKYDFLIMLDAGAKTRTTNKMDFTPPANLFTINIDHHEVNDYFGDLNFVDKTATSTCIVLYQLLKAWDADITLEMGTNLLLGMITDSGYFQFSGVTSDDLRAAAELLDMGVDMFSLIEALTLSHPPEVLKYRAIVYSRMEVDLERKCTYSYATREDMRSVGGNLLKAHMGSPAIWIRGVKGVDFAFFVKDAKTPEVYRVAFRARTKGCDVLKIAKALGGGGHKAAAGAFVEGAKDVQEVIDIVLKTIDQVSGDK